MKLKKNVIAQGLTLTLISIVIGLSSCKKDDPVTNNDPAISDFYKGFINNNIWEHGCILRANGTARYYVSFSGGAMSDTANSNVSKYEGTYSIVSSNDSVYINCADAGNTVTFRMSALMNSGHTSIAGTWVHSQGGITNTLPFTMAK